MLASQCSADAINQALQLQAHQVSELRARLKNFRLLSTRHWHKIQLWADHVELVGEETNFLSGLTAKFGIPDLSIVFRLISRASTYDLVMVSGGERGDMLYLAISSLIPWFKTPSIIVDAHWQKKDGIKYLIQRLIVKLGSRNVLQVQPHTQEEVGLYNKQFSIPIEKFHAVPWSTTLTGYSLTPGKGDYILTGGASYRDYDTFFKAIAEMRHPVEVGLPNYANIPIPTSVASREDIKIHTTLGKKEYYDKVAGCRIFALPITPGLTRSTGDQTILNAMAMGKIVVVTDSIVSRSIINSGVNGFIVPELDHRAWKETLQFVYSMNDAEYDKIASQARYDALVLFNEERRIYNVLNASIAALTVMQQ